MVRLGRSVAALAVTFVLGIAPVQAQTNYPERAVKIIVPIGPGGSYDLVGRALADALSKRMGQSFFVENKPGAGTVVGTQAAAQSEADGYTLVVGGLSNMAFNSALYSNLGYDPLRDFVPVAMVYRFGYIMVGRKDLPQASVQGDRHCGEGQARLDHGGHRRRRHRPASCRGRLHEGGRRQAAGSALQGLAAGLH